MFFWPCLYKIERFPMNDDDHPSAPYAAAFSSGHACTSAATASARPAWWASTSTPNGTLANSPTTSARAAERDGRPLAPAPRQPGPREHLPGYPEYEARQQDAVPNEYETRRTSSRRTLRRWLHRATRIAKEQYQALLPTLYEAARWGARPSSFPVERPLTPSPG